METADIWSWFAVVVLAIDITIRVVAIIVVPRNRRPTAGMAWLLAIFLIPTAGVILFLLIGSNRLPKARAEKHDLVDGIIRNLTQELLSEGVLTHEENLDPDWLAQAARLNRSLGSLPLTDGNSATLHSAYEESIEAMTAAVRQAKTTVNVEFYILALDATTEPFFDAMADAVKRGVTVKVLADAWATKRSKGYRRTAARLDEIGADWALMLPVRPLHGDYQRIDLRNHRKILVVDGAVGFIGSQNMIDSSYNKPKNIRRGLHWLDVMAEVHGSVVVGINAVFISDWFIETGELIMGDPIDAISVGSPGALECQIVPSGPGFADENNLQLFLTLLYFAERRIVITSPYFVPDGSIMNALVSATKRGVTVELFVSEIGDQLMVYHAQRSYYEALLRAGVRIYMYKAPYILHGKHFTIDDNVAVLGSSNMDMRSFSLNFEVSMMVHGDSFVGDLRTIEASYRAHSTELTLDEWLKQPLWRTVLDNLARLTSALQ